VTGSEDRGADGTDSGRASVVGVDSGGTFTDLVVLRSGQVLRSAKVPSSSGAPAAAVTAAINAAGLHCNAARLVHGTTVATNTVLQRTGAQICLLTTAGFEDVAFIQRLNRRWAFRLDWQKPEPLVLRRHIVGVRERIDSSGTVLAALNDSECARVTGEVAALAAAGEIDAVAVCLLFSYLNDIHERKLLDGLARSLPELPVSISSWVSPNWREYERVSTTLADAYVRPVMTSYLADLEGRLGGPGQVPLLVLKSNGGMGTPASILPRPVTTLLSGLAGGVVAGAYYARRVGEKAGITFDMGGTSTDIGIVRDGQVAQIMDYEIEWGLPVTIPAVDVNPIGAGGGSIARIDEGGLIQVGPESAGADPGPACYAKGGTAPTVTDANLVLGRLNPEYFLGGKIRLHEQAAMQSLGTLADSLNGATISDAASAVIQVANENMANSIRLVTIERGIDPREYSLIAFGGAGPLHACGVADAVGITRIIVPPRPGLCSAFGAAIAPLRVDRTWSLTARSDHVDESETCRRINVATEEVLSELRQDGASEWLIERRIACRYVSQNYEQEVLLCDMQSDFLDRAVDSFHRAHTAAFGYAFPGEPVEFVSIRITARELDSREMPTENQVHSPDAESHHRYILDDQAQPVRAEIVRHRQIPPRHPGPLLIEEPDSTVYVPLSWTASPAACGCLVLDRVRAQ
jgi:N-methylhydantoinase A